MATWGTNQMPRSGPVPYGGNHVPDWSKFNAVGGGAPLFPGGVPSGGLGGRLSPQNLRGADRQFDQMANMYQVPGAQGGILDGLKGLGGRLVGWAQANPELALGTAGLLADTYGAYKQGKREDREFEIMEEELRRRREEYERRRRAQQAASERIVARRSV